MRFFSHAKPYLAAGLVAVCLTAFTWWQLFPRFSTHLTSAEDGILISWIMSRVATALKTGQNPFQAPFFHPYQNTLAYSDPFFSTGLLTVAWQWLFSLAGIGQQNMLFWHNWHLVTGTMAVFLALWWVIWRITKDWWAAATAALFFTWSGFHMHYQVHLHTYLVAGLPLVVYGTAQWLKTNRYWYFLLAITAFLYQALNAPMTGLFALAVGFVTTITAGTATLKTLWANRQKVAPLLALHTTAIGAILALAYAPYWQVSQQFNYTRTIRDAAHFAHSLEMLLHPELLMATGLAVISWWVTRKQKNDAKHWRLWTSIALVGGILMLGPALKWQGETVKIFGWPIPLPYAVLYYLVPGFQAFRTSSRWVSVLNLGLAGLVGLSSAGFTKRNSKIVLFISLALFLGLRQLPASTLHLAYQPNPILWEQIAASSTKVVAELPAYNWNMFPYASWEAKRLRHQVIHGKKIYNGASGFTPPPRESEWPLVTVTFPSEVSLTLLAAAAVDSVVVHFDQYSQLWADHYSFQDQPSPNPELLRQQLDNHPKLELQTCVDQACWYILR